MYSTYYDFLCPFCFIWQCMYCEFMQAVSAKVKFQKKFCCINISYQKFTVNMLKIMVKWPITLGKWNANKNLSRTPVIILQYYLLFFVRVASRLMPHAPGWMSDQKEKNQPHHSTPRWHWQFAFTALIQWSQGNFQSRLLKLNCS